jgi:dolichol-phosphate mannosyltransferase
VAEGWASLMFVQLVMFCLLFLLLAIVSEYVSRILIEAKHRPLYYVREELGGTRLDIENIVDAR